MRSGRSLRHVDPAAHAPRCALPDLLSAVRREVSVPLVAAGGIATPDTVAEALATGAVAVMVGTVLLRTDEAGTSAPYRAALADPARRQTVVTRGGADASQPSCRPPGSASPGRCSGRQIRGVCRVPSVSKRGSGLATPA
ncbi:nitronate monooxygenase [Streptomyces cynarae]|uniref:Nitronate monooxygenase n=1 Tax=Streptomyces cynarae TaxID=2981134 RepID=A0ABY6E8T1_9ACTN|nr:nitronate monooxygenase [Streptomyces cynarae]UXY22980.1 nitronate monooxygenase [Streptomyces cynarae]